MQTPETPPSSFGHIGIGGHIALDWLNTAPGPAKSDDLEGPGAVEAWMGAAGLLDDADRAALEDLPIGARSRVADEIRALRDGLREIVREAPPEAMASVLALSTGIDGALARDDSRSYARLAQGRLIAERRRRWRTADPLLAILAEAVVDLAVVASPGRVRACAAADCILLFLDRTATNRRRWCSMQLCGNRAKVRELRRRRACPACDSPAGS